jgi:hypothetical protein
VLYVVSLTGVQFARPKMSGLMTGRFFTGPLGGVTLGALAVGGLFDAVGVSLALATCGVAIALAPPGRRARQPRPTPAVGRSTPYPVSSRKSLGRGRSAAETSRGSQPLEQFAHVLGVRERHPAALEFDSRAAGVADQLQDAHVHARRWTFSVRPARGTSKASAVGSSCPLGAAKPYTVVAEMPTSILSGRPDAAPAARIPASEPAAKPAASPTPPSSLPASAHERAHEQTTAVAIDHAKAAGVPVMVAVNKIDGRAD